MRKWNNFDKFIAHRDFVMLDNEEVQGYIKIDDLPRVIEDCDLHHLNIIQYDMEREIVKNIRRVVFYDDGRIEKEILFENYGTTNTIEGIDPLNIFGRILVNNAMLEQFINEYNN